MGFILNCNRYATTFVNLPGKMTQNQMQIFDIFHLITTNDDNLLVFFSPGQHPTMFFHQNNTKSCHIAQGNGYM